MRHSNPEPEAATPEASAAGGRARRGTALLVVALLTAVTSALFIANAGTGANKAAPKTAASGVTTLDVAQAAAYAATSAGTIAIKNYAFAPASTTVAAGTTVTWVNEDSVPHTVTTKSGPASFDSGQIASGASYSVIFKTAGTYSYYCIDHPQMVGTVTVTAGGPPPPPTSSGTTPGTTPPPTTPPATTPHTTPPTTSVSPTAPPTTSPTSTMSMPGGPPGTPGASSSGSCASLNQVLLPLLQHINTTHLGESPGQQVNDLLNLDQYVLTHTTLIENMIAPTEGVLTGTC